jgi:hypothetical protein
MGSLSLRPGDSLTIPKMALSIGFMSFVSSAHATQTTGLLTVTPVGLTPTENASLSWTHSHRKPRPRCGPRGYGFLFRSRHAANVCS